MSFEHRKYHGLYFILGFIIAAMLVMLLRIEEYKKNSPGEDWDGVYRAETK